MLTDDELSALLDVAKGQTFENRRDTALLRLLIDTGARAAEAVGLAIDDLDFDQDVAHVMGKGRRGPAVPFGCKNAEALRRHLRTRARHPQASRGGSRADRGHRHDRASGGQGYLHERGRHQRGSVTTSLHTSRRVVQGPAPAAITAEEARLDRDGRPLYPDGMARFGGLAVVPTPAMTATEGLVYDASGMYLVVAEDFNVTPSEDYAPAYQRDSVALRTSGQFAVAVPVPAMAVRRITVAPCLAWSQTSHGL